MKQRQKSTRDYAKPDSDADDERRDSRAGKDNSQFADEEGFRNPALFKKDPYSSQEEVDPPAWLDDSKDVVSPDDRNDYSKDET